MRRPGIEPDSSTWEAEILTDGPPVLIPTNNKSFKNITLNVPMIKRGINKLQTLKNSNHSTIEVINGGKERRLALERDNKPLHLLINGCNGRRPVERQGSKPPSFYFNILVKEHLR